MEEDDEEISIGFDFKVMDDDTAEIKELLGKKYSPYTKYSTRWMETKLSSLTNEQNMKITVIESSRF
eukprot:12883522-Prorocentrum_lima.AAC.1